MQETTLIICKPDALERQLVGNIVDRYENKGLKIIAMKMIKITKEQAAKHYEEHEGKVFYKVLTNFITKTPVVLLALKGDNAVEIARTINGATDATKALPGTIRGDLAVHETFNLVHSSDSVESAKRELNIFFNEDEYFEYETVSEKWINKSV